MIETGELAGRRPRITGSGQVAATALLLVAIVVQIAQGLFTNHHLTRFETSYWAPSYARGFVRRGLLGEVLRVVSGSSEAESFVGVAQGAVTATVIVLVVLLVVGLLRIGEPLAQCTAVLLVCAPFALDYLVDGMRPDQLGVMVVLAAGLALARFPSRVVVIAVVASGALVVSILAHEVNGLQALPWLVVLFAGALTLLRASARTMRTILTVILVPAGLTMAVVAASGSVAPDDLARMRSDAAAEGFPTGDETVLPYLADDAVDSLGTVSDLGPHRIAATGLASLLAIAITWLAVASSRLGRTVHAAAGDARIWRLAAVAAAVTLPFWVVQYAIAYDWQRWTSAYLCYALIVLGALLLSASAAGRPVTIDAAPVGAVDGVGAVAAYRTSWWWMTLPAVIVFAYLVALPPMPGWFETIREAIGFFVPGL